MALVELARYLSQPDAQVAASVLEWEGIQHFLFDEGTNLYLLGNIAPIRLMVDESDLDKAKNALNRQP